MGFIARLGSGGSREVVERALTALMRLSHRGGVDADGVSGDGAGLLTAIPQHFIRRQASEAGIELPAEFGLGMVFLPRDSQETARTAVEAAAQSVGLQCLGWRDVPTNPSVLGPRALNTLPSVQQCFLAADGTSMDLERRLFLARKRGELLAPEGTYFCSLSSRTVVYKGLLAPWQVPKFYPDLASEDFQSPFAIFHQRYSTNTQPAWSLAQPFRYLAHNGEINTIVGNRRWLRARAAGLRRSLDAPEWVRLLEERVSDSASFDNCFEILLRLGYEPEAAMLRMVPPAWENDAGLSTRLREYLLRQSSEQEPWDGPAALVFSDGHMVGAKLDRNGLRPLRYTVTSNGLIVVGSEAGIADLDPEDVAERQRLGPGEMLLVDTARGKIFRNGKLWRRIVSLRRASAAIAATRLEGRGDFRFEATSEPKRLAASMGWTLDQFQLLFRPLSTEGKDGTWSMGDDAPPAVLSNQRRTLWDYCKQRFAQVTNPAIDPLREAHVMSLDAWLGPNLVCSSPLLDAAQVAVIRRSGSTRCIDTTFEVGVGLQAARLALVRIKQEAEAAAHSGAAVLVSDRATCRDRAVVPILLASAAAWNAMQAAGGWHLPLIVESAEVFDTHHVAMVIAVGAAAVVPYLAYEFADGLKAGGSETYCAAVEAGLRKVLARMGISTLASYRNSRLFETVGLDPEVCAEFFDDAHAVLGGKTLDELLEECLQRHAAAYKEDTGELRDSGLYRFRKSGERHSTSPELVRRLHKFMKEPNGENQGALADLARTREPVAVRDLLEFVNSSPVPLCEVEAEGPILARFSTQAMSLGAISPEAHRTLAIAMNRMEARSNTGEGGEDPEIYKHQPEANNRVKQVASARFGVTTEYLVHADELEIKIAQGSKPGEGGQLPASKVSPYIARLRHATPGMALISPPPHHDIYSIEDLAQLIHDLRAVNPRARIGVKLVSGAGVGIIAAGVAKAGADVITISGYDGGTGASPLSSIKNTGLPWEVGLRDAHCTLLRAGLRGRVRLRVDGGLKFARDVVVAAMLGADEYGFGTSALLAIGCVMARQCHLNTCPVGIATQDETLRARFAGKPEMVITYFRAIAAEVRELLSSLGVRSLSEISGAVDRLRPRNPDAKRYLRGLLETVTEIPEQLPTTREAEPTLHDRFVAVLHEQHPVRSRKFRIANSDRSIGAYLSGELCRRRNAQAEVDELACEFHGTAGQSFGAYLTHGFSLRLIGEANDYVGKGLSGGRIAISAGAAASKRGDVLAGNTVLYGATAGELYIAGRAGERFAVRNSGALAVVEGVGQHGCEYMTAGVVVILGPAGPNLGSGMTGGLVYAMRRAVSLQNCNHEFVKLATVDMAEEQWVRQALQQHLRFTGSVLAADLLRGANNLPLVRVQPLQLPCTVAETWRPVLSSTEQQSRMLLHETDGTEAHSPVRQLADIPAGNELVSPHPPESPDREFIDSGWI